MSRAAVIVQAKQLQQKLDMKTLKHKEKNKSHCFIGSDCVQLMIDLKFASTEEEAIDFGNQLIQYNIIKHVDKHHTFKNENNLYYQFIQGYDGTHNTALSISSDISISSTSSSSSRRMNKLYSSSSRLMTNPRHRKASSNMTIASVSDLLHNRNGQNYVRRKDVYFRVNKYMRQNRLNDARNFLHDLLKYVSNKSNLDWSVLKGPTINNIDINFINSAEQEKFLQDTMGESRACWMDVTLLECKLKLFYELNSGDYELCKECINKLQSILDSLKRTLNNNNTLIIQSYYYRFMECETRTCLAYSIVKSNSIGYAAYAGLALEHCRKAMKLDPFHSLSHAVYGYLMDRCLDKFEEARQYLEYAIHLNNYYDNVNIQEQESKQSDNDKDKKKKKDKSYHRFAYIHIWLATLLVNFEEEFREIEYKMEIKLRAEFKKKYEQALNKKNRKPKRQRKFTDENENDDTVMRSTTIKKIFTNESEDDGVFSDNESDTSNKTPVGSPSVLLVKQLSHAHAYHRQRESLTRHLINTIQHGGAESFASIDFGTTQLQTHMSSTSDTPYNTLGSGSPISASVSLAEFPKPQQLTEESSINVENLIAERLADDTLTKHIGHRFGNEFMDQMQTISEKPADHFLSALKLEPQNGRFHSVYGVFLIHSEKFDAAKPHFEKAIKYDPNNVVSLNNLGYILSLSRFSQYQQAKNYLTKAAKLRPNNASIQFNLARLLAHAFGDEQIQNAKRYYLAALMNDNANSHIHYFYALFLNFIVKDNESAKAHLQKSKQYLTDAMSENQEFTDMTFEVNGYIEHAKTLQHESRFKAARFLLQRAAKLDMTKKREIAALLKSIEEEEKELDMLKRGY